jgi:hypothetical protein
MDTSDTSASPGSKKKKRGMALKEETDASKGRVPH